MYCFLLSTRWDHGVSSQEWYHGQEDRKRRGRRQPSPSLASLPSLATQSVESGKKISRKVLRSHCTNSNICFKQSVTSHRSQYFSNGSLSHSTYKYWTNCCIVLPFRWKKRKSGNLVTVVDPLQCSNVFLGASQVASWEHPESPVLCVIVCHHDKPPTGSIGICKVLNSLGFSKSRVIAIIKGFQVRRKK